MSDSPAESDRIPVIPPLPEPANMYEGDIDPDLFRETGHRIVDRIADYLDRGPEAPVLPPIEPGSIRKRLPVEAPERPDLPAAILDDFEEILYPGLTHWNSPRYMAYFPSVASAPGILAEMLSAGFGQNNMLWRTGPAATEMEIRTLEWLRDLLGLPEFFFGHIVDTASTATLLSLAAAREKFPDLALRSKGLAGRSEVSPLVIYASEEAHFSVDKAVMTLGYGYENLHKIPSDDEYRMRPDLLAEAVVADRREGRFPFAVVATVGTTSSTSIDPVPEIAEVCERERLWLHVDAAYGGAAAICPEMRYVLAGCDCADSIVVNPHKWLFTPFDLSAFFVRDRRSLRAAFSVVPEYITSDMDEDENLVNLAEYGFQMGRRWRSLKLWMVLRTYGAEGLRCRLRYHMELARGLASIIEGQEGVEMLAPVNFATVCFRFVPEGWSGGASGGADGGDQLEARLESLNAEVMRRANASGEVFLSHTKLKGRYTLRLAIGHVRTSYEDVRTVWTLLSGLSQQVASEMD